MPVQPFMTFARHQIILPPISTAARSFRGYRIPRLPGTEPTDQDGLICWGVVGDLPSPEPAPSTGFEVTKNEEWTEWSRKTQPVRIENPDDPDQYIMDDRPTTVEFTKTVRGSQAGNNTSAETPPGVSAYENTANFVDNATGETKTKVPMHYVTLVKQPDGTWIKQ